MKKTLIALAVAGVVAAPAAFAATSNVDIYGVMSYSVDRANTDDSTIDDTDLVTGRDNVSRIGFKGSEDLGGGLSAIWQVESQLTTGAGVLASRNTFVGLKSASMGTLILGQHDTPYKLATGKLDPFADTAADYNAIIGRSSTLSAGNLFDVRANQTVAYITPTFSGFHAALAYVQIKNIEALATDDDTSAWSMMGMYENGPLFASLAYEKHTGSVAGVGLLGADRVDSISAWKLGAGFSFGNAKIGAVYENSNGGDANAAAAGGEAHDRTAYYLSGQYNMGAIALKAAYGRAGDSKTLGAGDDDGAKFYALGADYSLSKRTTVYGVYTKLKNDGTTVAGGGYDLTPYASGALGNDPSVFSLGVKHTF
jgi:predicted porin